MPILIPFLILFLILGLFWVLAAGLLVGTLFSRGPRILPKVLEHSAENCACYLGLKHHDHV
ncbi:MAG TPA: hypothetical protein VLY24_26775 [Bryobacteraceae bacterium]|nr:hypothetical protein [Bryobacteraceae bacterium]